MYIGRTNYSSFLLTGRFCATANPTQVLVAETTQGRGIVGVVDGFPPKGVEGEADIEWRKKFLRQIGYKL